MTSSKRILSMAVLVGLAMALSASDVMAWGHRCRPVRRILAPQPASMSYAQAGAYSQGGMSSANASAFSVGPQGSSAAMSSAFAGPGGSSAFAGSFSGGPGGVSGAMSASMNIGGMSMSFSNSFAGGPGGGSHASSHSISGVPGPIWP